MRRWDALVDSLEESKTYTLGQLGRERWMLRHPVLAAIALGLGWALVCWAGSGFKLIGLALWLPSGLLFFGPFMVLTLRRTRRRHPLPDFPESSAG